MAGKMTPKERWLAALRMEPVDRLPFWPKLTAAYPPAQAEPFRSMAIPDIHRWIGSDRHEGVGLGVKTVQTRCRAETNKAPCRRETVYHTPSGTMRRVMTFDVDSQAWHPIVFPVASREQIEMMTEFYADARAEPDPEALAKARQRADETGQDAILAATIGTSALMEWVEHLAGVENAHLLMADHPAEVEALFAAMDALLFRKAALAAEHTPCDALYLTENTSTTLTSPAQFRRYELPAMRRCGEITRAAGRPLILHMCGHLKALLPDLGALPVAAFEAFTSPTLGNTTLLDGRSACPDKCLIGGTNAMLWLEPADRIIAQIDRDLRALPHLRGIVVTSAGVMPPLCKPETIKRVCEWVRGRTTRAED